jgi:DNA mismatch repair protein MutS
LLLHSYQIKTMSLSSKGSSKSNELSSGSNTSSKAKDITPTMAQYLELKEQYQDSLLFFRLGDFYELFFQDAVKASQALNIVLTHRGKHQGQPVPMCGIPCHASDHYLGKLIRHGFKVAICEQTETPKEKTGTGPLKRDVVRVITPGTLLEEPLLEDKKNNFLAALCEDSLEKGFLGIAFADISTGEFFSERLAFPQLASTLERIRPSEMLVPESLFNQPTLTNLWNEWRYQTTPLPDSRFHPQNGKERLETFFQVKTIESFGSFSPEELGAAGALTDYILLTQKRNVLQLSRLRKLNHDDYVAMDGFTRKNLELLYDASGGSERSLLKTIDRTITPGGARLLSLRLNHPLQRLETIDSRLDSVSYFIDHGKKRIALRDLLRSWPDSERMLTRALSGRNCPRDLGSIRDLLLLLPKVAEFFPIRTPQEALAYIDQKDPSNGFDSNNAKDVDPDFESTFSKQDQDGLAPLPKELYQAVIGLGAYPELTQELSSALGDVLPMLLKDGGVIRTGYHPHLDCLRQTRNKVLEELQALQQKYVQETQIHNLKISHNMVLGHYIEVPPGAASKMPFMFQLKQSLVTSVRYTTPELAEFENRLNSSQEEAQSLEQQIFEGLLDHLRQAVEPLRQTARSVAILDVSCALAELAVTQNYHRPRLDHSKTFYIKQGRHPVVERHTLDDTPYTKNDCHLDEAATFWLLTGPNMAGKSTFLRQNAIIALMAHIGSFVPADEAHIGLIDRIFSRVGASDDLARGYSTFMMEMVETATILNQATEKSFIILDELGRGTGTYDGLSLAWSCVEHFVTHLKSRTLFATHYQELTRLEDLYQNIRCYTLKIKEWGDQIVFLHEVIPGTAGRSYGLHVAQLAGIPIPIIQRASEILALLENNQDQNTLKNISAVPLGLKNIQSNTLKAS